MKETREHDWNSPDGLAEMLRDAAARVGAHAAMLVRTNGTVVDAFGFPGRIDVDRLGSCIANASSVADLISTDLPLDSVVDFAVPDQLARVYARRIEGDLLLVTVFDLGDAVAVQNLPSSNRKTATERARLDDGR